VDSRAADFGALCTALGQCGLEEAAQDAVVAISSIAHIATIGMLAMSDVTRICKVIKTCPVNPIMITVMQVQLMQGMHFWVTNCQQLGLPVSADEFATVTAFNQTVLMMQMNEDDAREEKDQVAQMPEKFKKVSEYKVFAESLDTYLGLLQGTGKIPLKYVICQNAIPDLGAIYLSENEQHIAIAPRTGPEFNGDNAKVYRKQ
jgi:hypothetical protein